MANNISTYLKNALLNEILGASNFAPAATLYARAFSTVLTAAGAGTELAGNGYAPIEITNNSTNFPAAVAGQKELAVMHETAAATADWSGIMAVGLFDAASGGNLYIYENYPSPVNVVEGQKFRLPIGGITAQIS